MGSKLIFALRDQKPIGIEEAERGLNCNAVCLKCGDKLEARKGDINDHHFSHYNSDCGISYESLLHLLAKKILEEERKINLPDRNSYFIYKTVKLENKLGDIIPDIILNSENEEILIEIAVTNPCSKSKISKIKSLNFSVLEIDLSKIDKKISIDALRSIIIDKIENKIWIHKKTDQQKNKSDLIANTLVILGVLVLLYKWLGSLFFKRRN